VTRRGIAAWLAAGALALAAGCGSSSSGGASQGAANNSSAPPKTELSDALHALHDGQALTTTLSLGTTSANLIALSGEGGDTPLTQQQADLISSARLVIATVAPEGKTLAQEAAATPNSDGSVSISGSAGGTTYFTLLSVNHTFYFQLDLKDLLGDVGQAQQYDMILRQAAAVPNLPPFVNAFLAGKFVSLPLSTLKNFSSFMQGFVEGALPGGIPSQTQIRAMINQVTAAVSADLTVSRTATGTTDKFVITGNVRNIARDLLSTLQSALPQGIGSQIDPAQADQVPDQDLSVDAEVTGGALSRLSFDAGQFSPHHKDTLPVVATFARSAPAISAPSGATAVDLQQLTQFFTALGQATSVTSSGSGSSGPHPLPTAIRSSAPPK
jgi:hypothetical protein